MSPTRVAVLTFDGISLFHLSVPGMVLSADDGPARYEVMRYVLTKTSDNCFAA